MDIQITSIFTKKKGEATEHITTEMEQGYYTSVTGKYQNWDDFEKMCCSVFTEEAFHYMNYERCDVPCFISIDDKAYYLSVARGYNVAYAYDREAFTLIKQSEDEILFTVTCFLHEEDLEGNREDKVFNAGEGFEFYKSFNICMVRTTDGWRFSEFHMGSLE